MTQPRDYQSSGMKFYQDRTPDVPNTYRNTQKGAECTDQSIQGLYTISKKGDETSWQFWDPNNRVIGSWSQAVPAIVLENTGLVQPLLSGTLEPDPDYLPKQLVDTPPAGDYAQVRNATGGPVEAGQIGIVLQCLNSEAYENVFIATGQSARRYARIRWNYGRSADLSEGEIAVLSAGSYLPTGIKVWIDFQKSRFVQFETAGDGCFFDIVCIEADHDRGGDVRDLCYVHSCVQDSGKRITHAEVTVPELYIADTVPGLIPVPVTYLDITVGNAKEGRLLSRDLTTDQPYLDPVNSTIFTTIAGVEEPNASLVRIPLDWDVTNIADNYRYLEIMESGRGQPLFFQPIQPKLADYEIKTYQMNLGETPVAQYRRQS